VLLSALPLDFDVSRYTNEQLIVVMRLLNVPREVLISWYRLGVDGRIFAAMSDDELRLYQIDLPLIRQLRDCSRTSLQKCSRSDESAAYDDGYVKLLPNRDL